jgi:hypothetical protein
LPSAIFYLADRNVCPTVSFGGQDVRPTVLLGGQECTPYLFFFFFGATDFVAEFRCQFVIFVFNSFFQRATQADQLRSFFYAGNGPMRMLAHMRQLAVNAHYQRFELSFEADIIVWATEPPLTAKLVKRNSADRARLLIELGQFFGRLTDCHLMSEHSGHAAGGGCFTCR